jgi:hypothetical protein
LCLTTAKQQNKNKTPIFSFPVTSNGLENTHIQGFVAGSLP